MCVRTQLSEGMTTTTINSQELRAAIDAGDVVVVEALPASYYAEGHLPGARNLALDDLDRLAGDVIPRTDQPVVTYCTGPTCSNSHQAAERLRALGYTDVRVFAEGKDGWRAAGLPIETETQPAD